MATTTLVWRARPAAGTSKLSEEEAKDATKRVEGDADRCPQHNQVQGLVPHSPQRLKNAAISGHGLKIKNNVLVMPMGTAPFCADPDAATCGSTPRVIFMAGRSRDVEGATSSL